MKKQFVTYEIALKLKELGFDEHTLGYFGKDNNFRIAEDSCNYGGIYSTCPLIRRNNFILAPLWQQVIDWLREKYDYNITYNVLKGFDGEIVKNYIFKGGDIQSNFKILSKRTDFYEAREQAILKAIELCAKKE